MKNSAWWQMSVAIATVTLGDRKKRRQCITGILIFLVAYFAFGNWVIDSWLERGLLRMLIFWGFLGFMLIFMMFFALFDALSVIGEERGKAGLAKKSADEEISRD